MHCEVLGAPFRWSIPPLLQKFGAFLCAELKGAAVLFHLLKGWASSLGRSQRGASH